jgi:ATP-dependent protease ClpP protease subunit
MAIFALNFHGPMAHPSTTKFRNGLCAAVNERLTEGPNAGKRKCDELYLFMDTTGGQIDDGFSLFGLIRSLPFTVTTINTGLVASIGILPFIAGHRRIALPHAQFHFHDFDWNYPAAHNLTRLEYLDHTQILDSFRQRTLEILKENTSLTDEDFQQLKLLEVPVIKTASFAKEKGIVHEIKYVTVPEATNLFNIDY